MAYKDLIHISDWLNVVNCDCQQIVYSRRNFMEPGQQPSPHRYFELGSISVFTNHRSWEEEASNLRSVFSAGSGRKQFCSGFIVCTIQRLWFFWPTGTTMMYGCEVIFFWLHVLHHPAFTMGSIYGDCWHFFRFQQGCKWVWKPIEVINNWKRSTPDQKLELMMTELDDTKMRIFDQKFSKDGLDCRQVISFQHFQSASEVGHWQAAAWDEDGRLPLLSHWLLHERDHGGRGWKLYKSSELGGTQEP